MPENKPVIGKIKQLTKPDHYYAWKMEARMRIQLEAENAELKKRIAELEEAGNKLAELPRQMLKYHNEPIGQSEVEDYLTEWQAALGGTDD